jgi:hypothetical protein
MKFIPFLIAISFVNLLSQQNDYWKTYFEKSNYLETPRYKETMGYFKKFEKHSPYVKMISIGKSGEGRDIYVLIISKDKAFTPELARKTGKPIVFIQNGIHAGEIDGKDASMILLREILITKEKINYIDNAILLVMPIFNVDGHERFSPFNRINQNGPKEMGWRTNAQNLNLNRDYMKADSPEMKAWLKFFNQWLPHIFVDCHVTDGADYQYQITYSCERYGNVHPLLGKWIQNEFVPFIENEVQKNGYLIAPYVWFKGDEIKNGIVDGVTSPRLSTGYVAIQNRVALLIETHMLKDYKTRVFATLTMLDAVIRKANQAGKYLVELIDETEKQTINEIANQKNYLPIKFQTSNEFVPFWFKGIKYEKVASKISGREKIVYTGEKFEIEIPLYNKPIGTDSVKAPDFYLIPKSYSNIIQLLELHGVKYRVLKSSKKFLCEKYRFDENTTWQKRPYEGRIMLSTKYETFIDTVIAQNGDYLIPVDQRAIKVIMYLLEPKSGDSFISWGFFNSIFERKEYYEEYVMEKLAEEMYNSNELLRKEFEEKLKSDSTFASSAEQRLEFFYRRSPYFDKQWLVYPVFRVIKSLN